MKRTLLSILLACLFSTCMYAFFPAYVNYPELGGPLPHSVMCIAHDDANVYLVKLDGYLVIIDKATGELKTVKTKVGGMDQLQATSISVNGGKVWIGTLSPGTDAPKLMHYVNGRMASTGLKLSRGSYSWGWQAAIENITFDPSGNAYVATSGGYVFRIDPKNNITMFNLKWHGFFSGFCFTPDGTYWVGRFHNPIFCLELQHVDKNGEFTYFKGSWQEGLPYFRSSGVRCLDMDKEGGVWFVGKNGLNRIVNNEIAETYECPKVCDGFGMRFDDEQRLWMTGYNGPLTMMKDGVFTSYPCPYDSKIWTCMDVDGDTVYIGTDRSLLIFKDGEYAEILFDGSTPSMDVNELTGVDAVSTSAEDAPCFDLQGRRLSGVPQRGMYIQNGRKYVVK